VEGKEKWIAIIFVTVVCGKFIYQKTMVHRGREKRAVFVHRNYQQRRDEVGGYADR